MRNCGFLDSSFRFLFFGVDWERVVLDLYIMECLSVLFTEK